MANPFVALVAGSIPLTVVTSKLANALNTSSEPSTNIAVSLPEGNV